VLTQRGKENKRNQGQLITLELIDFSRFSSWLRLATNNNRGYGILEERSREQV
jgi:hypothetical protein